MEIEHVLAEVQGQLMEAVLAGHDAGLCLVGGRRTGKSSCLLGGNDDQVITGLLPQFAEAYYQHQEQNAVRIIELAIIQVYKEQVYDLLLPQRDDTYLSVKRNSGCISAHGRTYHVARSRDEFLTLVASALSVKAVLSLQSDIFLHSAHMHIHCICQCQEVADVPPAYQSALTLVDVGTSILPGGLVSDNKDEFVGRRGSTVEQSLLSFQNSVTADYGRIVWAETCNSVLTSLLADMFTSSVQTIWLGCISPTLVDIDETEFVLELLAKVRQFQAVQASTDAIVTAHGQMLAATQERLEITRVHAEAREGWLNASGMKAFCASSYNPTTNCPCLTNLSSDV